LGILSRLGYKADVAANGLEVLKALELADYDVVLMDVQMPEMDGLAATRHVRQNVPREKRPRIVAMTANAMHGDRERCLEAGMDDYIPKPIRHEDLSAALDRCVRIALNRRPAEAPGAPAPKPMTPATERTPRSLDLNSLIGPRASRPRPTAEAPDPGPAAPPAQEAAERAAEAEPSETVAAPSAWSVTPVVEAPPMPASEAPAAPGPLPPVDPAALEAEARAIHTHLRELTGVEDLGFVEEVLSSYLRADLVLVAQIREAHAAGDSVGVAKAVHKLKSSSGILGAGTLAAHCAELEEHARSGQLDGTDGLAEAVEHGVRL